MKNIIKKLFCKMKGTLLVMILYFMIHQLVNKHTVNANGVDMKTQEIRDLEGNILRSGV